MAKSYKHDCYRLIFWMLLGAGIISCQSPRQNPPNILFILVDDLGWADLSCYGSSYHETPNIDLLAAEGIRFTQAYASSPVCSPTRAAIMTGKNPTRIGITDWIPGQDPRDRKLLGAEDRHALPLEEKTLAEAFKEGGYKTFFAGKWHLGDEGYYPENQGFEINLGGHDKGSPSGGYFSPYKNPKLTDGPEGEYLTDRLTNESLQFIENNQKQPFFLFLSYYTVHTPIQANPLYLEKYQEKLAHIPDSLVRKSVEHEGMSVQNQANPAYASMVHAMDKNVGRIKAKLEELGLLENTLIVFTSDNGGLSTLFPNRTAPTSVRPLRGGKGWCYEGGIRVPLIFYQKGKISPAISEEAVISHDFYPSLLNWAKINPGDQKLDGVDLSPLLSKKNTSLQREELFWHFPHYHGSAWKPGAALRKGNWKLIEFYEEGKAELYKLDEDIGESKELSQEFPEVFIEMRERLKELQMESKAKFPQINPDY